MLQITTPNNIPIETFEDEISINGFSVYIDQRKYTLSMMIALALTDTALKHLLDKIIYMSNGRLRDFNKESFGRFLIKCGAPENIVCSGTGGRVALNKARVISPLLSYIETRLRSAPVYYADLRDLVLLYKDYIESKHRSDTMFKKHERFKLIDEYNKEGQQLCEITSLYERQSTGRYYTNSDNLQGWNLYAVPTFNCPKDYFLVWADFDQIDLAVAANMILFNGKPELREIFSMYPDKYEAMSRIIYDSLNMPFDKGRFQLNRKPIKTSILARLYGAGLDTIRRNGFKDLSDAHALDTYFNNHKYYNEYRTNFEKAITFGGEVTARDYFGIERTIPVPQNPVQRSRVIDKCLNTPIQSTSNDIVMLWVLNIVKYFRDMGVGKELFRPYLLRHDEGLFIAHKSLLEHMWIFKQFGSIAIDDWSEITVSPKFGYHYTVEDEELTDAYEKAVTLNQSKITPYQQGAPSTDTWVATGRPLEVYVYAPVTVAVFIYNIIQYAPGWELEAQELYAKIRSKDLTATQYATKVIQAYADEDSTGVTKDKLSNYNKYGGIFALAIDGVYYTFTASEFLSYIKDNNYKYLTLHNSTMNDYVIHDGVQMRYNKCTSYHDVVNVLKEAVPWTKPTV